MNVMACHYPKDFDFQAAVQFWRPDYKCNTVSAKGRPNYGSNTLTTGRSDGHVHFIMTDAGAFVDCSADRREAWRGAMCAVIEFMEKHREVMLLMEERCTWNIGDLEIRK